MDDELLLRYSRQIMLPDLDIAGQEKLQHSRVIIIGLGGLGSPAALYLAASGVGSLVLNDFDDVDLSNLQRQIAHSQQHIGMNKAESAARQIAAINSHTRVEILSDRLDAETLTQALADVDVVLDCTDNFQTRFMLNETAWKSGTPVVSGAAIGWEGHLSVFDPGGESSPCYRCLYQEGDDGALNCAENGVIAPLVGIIGTIQALEAIKLVTGIGECLVGRVMYFDAKYMEWRSLKLKRRVDCPVCSPRG